MIKENTNYPSFVIGCGQVRFLVSISSHPLIIYNALAKTHVDSALFHANILHRINCNCVTAHKLIPPKNVKFLEIENFG